MSFKQIKESIKIMIEAEKRLLINLIANDYNLNEDDLVKKYMAKNLCKIIKENDIGIDLTKCMAKVSGGSQCSRSKSNGTDYCKIHGKKKYLTYGRIDNTSKSVRDVNIKELIKDENPIIDEEIIDQGITDDTAVVKVIADTYNGKPIYIDIDGNIYDGECCVIGKKEGDAYVFE